MLVDMGDAATAIYSSSSSSCRPPPLHNWKYRAQPWRNLLFASRIRPISTNRRGIEIRLEETWTLRRPPWASFLFRLKLAARASELDEEDRGNSVDARPLNAMHPSNEAPSATPISMEAQTNLDVMPSQKGSQQSVSDIQYMNLTKEVPTSNKQTREMATNKQEAHTGIGAPQRSLEEDYGLLKEQVEEDRRIQLASKQDSHVKSMSDTAKPLKRSKIIAKQVISQASARIIGFVSQLWVSIRLFRVVALEVRPSLLSGEIDRVFIADVCQIGDVVLVSDESALENEITASYCETLVGYDVVTEDGNYIGKIRDYSFDLQDGKLTSLDIDSVGISLVPSSLISTYRLDAEEVVEVLTDTIMVKRDAESRIRRLTKGFWQLPDAGGKRKSEKMTRRRRFPESMGLAGQGRPFPSSVRPRYFERLDFESLDARERPADHGPFPKDYDRLPQSRGE